MKIKEKLYPVFYMNCHKLFLCIFYLIVPLTSYGQDKEIKEYIIEVIVFEQLELETEEALNPFELDITGKNLISLSADKKLTLNIDAINKSFAFDQIDVFKPIDTQVEVNKKPSVDTIINKPHPIIQMKRDKWFVMNSELNQLSNIHSRLKRRKEYKILHKVSWLQPALSMAEAPYIHEQFNENGLILKLYQSRYLHLDLIGYINGNLQSNPNTEVISRIKLESLIQSIPKDITMHDISFNPEILYGIDLGEPILEEPNQPNQKEIRKGMVEFILKEDRRIFKNESHYFDHPKMGIIVAVYDSSL